MDTIRWSGTGLIGCHSCDTDGNQLHVVATGFHEDWLHTYKSQELVHKSRALSLCISITSLICMKQQVFQPPLSILGTYI